MSLSGICLITDPATSGQDFRTITRKALSAGIRWIQYREKQKTRRELYEEALLLNKSAKRYGALFIVNDHADIALAVGADGVHLGQDDLPVKEARKIVGKRMIIGISTHNLRQAEKAQKEGADYIGYGPIFATSTKDAGEPKGVRNLAIIQREIRIPVVAIGGITLQNLPSVLCTGVQAVASASALLKGDIEDNVKKFQSAFKAAGCI